MAVLFRREAPLPSLPTRTGSTTASTPRTPAAAPTGRVVSIEQIIQQRLVTAEFQPIVRLSTNEVVAYEALARGPADSQYGSPGMMFAAASGLGMVGDLDVVAHSAAYWAALNGSKVLSLPLFVNADPAGLLAPVPEDLQEVVRSALTTLHVFMEVSERSVVADPVGSLVAMEYARRAGWRLSLDNVGASPAGLSLLPYLQPDVIKMDMSLVTRDADIESVRIMSGLAAHVEATGAVLAAQGIETDGHRNGAIGMGALLGQGYSFGRPLTLPVDGAQTGEPYRPGRTFEEPDTSYSPFPSLKRTGRQPTPAPAATVRALGLHLDSVVAAGGEPVVVTMCDGLGLSGSVYGELRNLVRRASMTVMLTQGPATRVVPGLETAELAADDPLQGELVLAITGPHLAAMLTVRRSEAPDSGGDWET